MVMRLHCHVKRVLKSVGKAQPERISEPYNFLPSGVARPEHLAQLGQVPNENFKVKRICADLALRSRTTRTRTSLTESSYPEAS